MKNLILGFICLVILSSCGGLKRASNSANNLQKLEREFQNYKGIRYKYGGTDKNGFDCSGFVQLVYANAFNINLPRTTEQMAELGKKKTKSNLRIGDLIFFKPSRKYRHVGIYMGKNEFMHSSTSKGIIKSKLDNPYWKKKYRYSKRILKK